MRAIRIAVGMALILGGMALGLFVTLHYFAEGIQFIRAGQLRQGLILMLVWSELLGIVATLVLVVPGVLLLRNLYRGENSRVAQPTSTNVLTDT